MTKWMLCALVPLLVAVACGGDDDSGNDGAGGADSGTGGASGGTPSTGGAVADGGTSTGGAPPTGGIAGMPTGGSGGSGGTVDAGAPDGAPDGAAITDGGDSGVAECTGDCPLGVSVGAVIATSPSLGGGGGSPFMLECGAGQVLTGFELRYTTQATGELMQLTPECSSIELVPGASDGTFEVHTSNPTMLASTGGTTGGIVALEQCPENQMVLGIIARVATSEVRRFGFYCGSASVARAETGPWDLTVGPVSYTSPEHGRDPGPVTTSYICPSGTAATQLAGRSDTRIHQVSIGCAPLAVPVPCGAGEGGVTDAGDAADGGSGCSAVVAQVPNTHTMTVAENGTASLTCSSGTITSFTSTYGSTCAGTCPVSCGQCTLGSAGCSVTYNNTNCTDCQLGCNKAGALSITCE